MIDAAHQIAFALQAFTNARNPFQPEHRQQRWPPYVSFYQQGLLMCSLSEGAGQIGGNHRLTLLRNCARDQHLFERAVPAKMLQADTQKAKFLCCQTLAVSDAYQATLGRNRNL